MVLLWRLLIVVNGMCALGATSHVLFPEKQRERVYKSSAPSLEVDGCNSDNSPDAAVPHCAIPKVADGQHYQKDTISSPTERGISSSTTIGYNISVEVQPLLLLKCFTSNSNWCTPSSHSNGEITTSPTPVSEVVTWLSYQSNPSLEGILEDITIENTSVVTISNESKLLKSGENLKKQGMSSSTTIGYNNSVEDQTLWLLKCFSSNSTWHTHSRHSNGETTGTNQPTFPTTQSEVTTGQPNQLDSTLEGVLDGITFENTSVVSTSTESELVKPGEF